MEYTISIISDFGSPGGSRANAVNAEGTVVGGAYGPGYKHAFRSKNNLLTDLTNSPDIEAAEAFGINNNVQEQIVGEHRENGQTQAFYWQNGVFTDLHPILGGTWGSAKDINDAGQIVGTRGGTQTEAFIYDLNTNAIISPNINSNNVFGEAINSHGHIVGRAMNLPQGFVYDGSVKFLPTLGGNATEPTDINDIGIVVGTSGLPNDDKHAFVYDSNGIHDIHDPVATYSKAFAINNHNVIVGQVNYGSGPQAFIKEPGKDMELLLPKIKYSAGYNILWSELWYGLGINDEGQICGKGVVGGESQGFLLTPVKESPFEILDDLPLLVAEILFGVGTGGGGVIVVGGNVIPIDPPLPYREVLALGRDQLGRIFSENLVARSNNKIDNMESFIKKVYDEGVANYKDFYKGQRMEMAP